MNVYKINMERLKFIRNRLYLAESDRFSSASSVNADKFLTTCVTHKHSARF